MKRTTIKYESRMLYSYHDLTTMDVCRLRLSLMNKGGIEELEEKHNVSIYLHDNNNDGIWSFSICIEAYESRNDHYKNDTYADHYIRMKEIESIITRLRMICDKVLRIE